MSPESFLTKEAPRRPGRKMSGRAVRIFLFLPILNGLPGHVPDSGAQPLSGPALQVRDDSLRRPGCAEMDIRSLSGHGVKQPVLIL